MDQSNKYLSFVVTSRNDGGTEGLQRTQLFIDTLLEQLRRYHMNAELIVVEWNPPSDHPPLARVLRRSDPSRSCPVRIIQVPAEIHRRFENCEIIPLFQMIAKNIGIRRAHGEFVLATNIDILFSNDLMQFFASQQLDPDQMYRMDRYDVEIDFSKTLSPDELLNWCNGNILRVYRYLETVPAENGVIPPPKKYQLSTWKKIVDRLLRRERPLHTNASGDFTLLAMKYWEKVAGYAEFPMRAMKIDGLLCYAAHFAGARQQVLKDPMRIYHMEHPARADGAVVALSKRSTDAKSVQIPYEQYQTWVEQMIHTRRPVIFNGKDWGLANDNLPETVLN